MDCPSRCADSDAVPVEGLLQPFACLDLGHADGRAVLIRKLRERGIAFANEQIVGLFGGVLIDADAAAAHLVHHRQQVDFQPIGVARSFPLDDLLENFGQLRAFAPRRSRRRGRLARRQPPDVGLDRDVLA